MPLVIRALFLLVITVAIVAGCGSATTLQAGKTTTTTTTAVGIIPGTTAPAPTTATAGIPAAPQSTPDAAAQALVDNWVANKRTVALSVATPMAVSTLFAQPYRGQTVVNRDCTVTYMPYVCSFGPNGGGSGSLYQIYLGKAGQSWYVTSVVIEG